MLFLRFLPLQSDYALSTVDFVMLAGRLQIVELQQSERIGNKRSDVEAEGRSEHANILI